MVGARGLAPAATRTTFQPGWRWSGSIKPVVGTPSCKTRHIGTVASGRLHVVHEDGSHADLAPGSVYIIEPGHDAWVVGDSPFVSFEFAIAETYGRAKP